MTEANKQTENEINTHDLKASSVERLVIKNKFIPLKGCLETEVESSDGAKLILFHDVPLEDYEIEIFKSYTSKEIGALLTGLFDFKAHSLVDDIDNAKMLAGEQAVMDNLKKLGFD